MRSFAGPSYLTIFTIYVELDPGTYVGNLSNMHSISTNKQ